MPPFKNKYTKEIKLMMSLIIKKLTLKKQQLINLIFQMIRKIIIMSNKYNSSE